MSKGAKSATRARKSENLPTVNLEDLPPHVQRHALKQILREDFRAFVRQVFETLHPSEDYLQNWHIDYLCGILARQREGKRLRKIINLPPRSLKSVIVSVALPAWLMGHDPAVKIIVVSYADELARKFSRDFRAIVTADWYRNLFPEMKLSKKTEVEIETTQGGYRIATSTGGTITGRGANLIILDDPIKPADAESEVARPKNNDWFDKTLFARLDSKEHGSIVLVMQRLHQNDLSGHLLEKGGFDLIALPARAIADEQWRLSDGRIHRRKIGQALHPARESLGVLAEIEASQGSRVFQAQYQQQPVPAEGNLFKAAWMRYSDPPPREQMKIIQSWDTASGIGKANDYSVGTTWGIKDKIYYLLDVRRGRWELPELARQVVEMANQDKATAVLIEDASSGAGLIQLLRTSGLNVIGRKPRLEKEVRAATQSACFEAGRVILPKTAAWIADYETELLGFPSAKFDDQVDSTTQFLEWAQERDASKPPIVGLIVGYQIRPPWLEAIG